MRGLDLLSCELCGSQLSFVGMLAPSVVVATCDVCDQKPLAERILAMSCDERRWSSTHGAVDVFYYLVSNCGLAGRCAAEAVLSRLFFIVDEAMRGVPTDVIGDRLMSDAGLTPRISE